VGEVLAMGDQALLQLAGKQGNVVDAGVMTKWQVMQTLRLRVLSSTPSSR
jgi:hypothetical protein